MSLLKYKLAFCLLEDYNNTRRRRASSRPGRPLGNGVNRDGYERRGYGDCYYDSTHIWGLLENMWDGPFAVIMTVPIYGDC